MPKIKPSHTIFISIGSNVDKEINTKAGLNSLSLTFDDLVLSAVYESEAVGFEGSNFYNLVVKAKTSLAVEEVCRTLKSIEKQHGRKRSEQKFSPRTLDLDLLLYDQVILEEPVELPRPEVLYNAFVLKPLAEIAPEVKHPIVNKTYAELWHDYDKSLQRLWAINFEWSPTSI
ncbi:2-amino-4-hydroxy-6-hydroxymethyldihydropteridine diphosphokinase [Paraglaciecola sp. 2405UD69-4]|uniref:2-amino-4-hydroxy-6- hydroxymethyldihydropteridine diphosphokinase n=1 Tax=Paraglaciecola sp. 2405UD69-4 TaxID=3391836 RepID=UPI0039C92A60